MALAVLDALDQARTQWYHITAIVIAGMGFFTDAYDLFCISTVSKLLGRLYYFDPTKPKPGKLPPEVDNLVIGSALVGTLSGQLVFGWLGDKLGRKKVYGITLILMVACAICSGLSFGSTPKSVMVTLRFFRFWLGGDYPLSATIMPNTPTKGHVALSSQPFWRCKAWGLYSAASWLCLYLTFSYQTIPRLHTNRTKSCPHNPWEQSLRCRRSIGFNRSQREASGC